MKASDILFAISAEPENCCGDKNSVIVITTPVKYWKKNKFAYDQHQDIGSILPAKLKLVELMESTYESHAHSAEETHSLMLEEGFIEDQEFIKFVNGIVFAPAKTIPAVKQAKLSTEICKAEICKIVKANPDACAAEFVPSTDSRFAEQVQVILDEATNKNNWKRRGKRKKHGGIVRDFDCEPFDNQLRAYVYSNADDTEILKIEINGE